MGVLPNGMAPVSFFQRSFPNANSVLLRGSRPVLVDSGYGADAPALVDWLAGAGVPANRLSMVVNTHFHCDHVGGNHLLQNEYDVVVAAEAGEAALVNTRNPDACRAVWLRQPVEAYTVRRPLRDGDRVGTGEVAWTVVATPGHTAGHISLHSAEHGVLVLGDALHGADIGWLNPYREGRDALDRSAETLERLSMLHAHTGYSGHGPPITDLPTALERARTRLVSWRQNPERIAWHACKRIFAHHLIVSGGLTEPEITAVLLDAPWFVDHATHAFQTEPAAFVPVLVDAAVRGDAARWQGDRLVATAVHTSSPAAWTTGPTVPAEWPAVSALT